MRVAIVDDESRERDTLRQYLSQYEAECAAGLEAVVFSSGDELLSGYCRVYDILLLDIEMQGTNGMDTARKIRQQDADVVILFITNIAQYAISGYEVAATDYILKPISYYDFKMKFRRAVELAQQRSRCRFLLEFADGMRQVPVMEIAYVESYGHYLIYHVGKEEIRARENISDCERKLKEYGFCRIHKSYLVNLEHIVEIRAGSLLLENAELPVSRSYRENLVSAYFRHIRH